MNKNVISIGTACTYRHLESHGAFAVYCKIYQDGTNRLTYIIARQPPVQTYTMPPASVLEEFNTEAEALEAFQRWKLDPIPPDPVRRPKNPCALRRSKPGRSRSRRKGKSPFQGEFDLGLISQQHALHDHPEPETLMPSFTTLPPRRPPIPAGVHVVKIIAAKEKLSEAGKDMIVMKLMVPDGRTIGSVLTFCEAARPVISAFCGSAGLRTPAEADIAVDLTASHCLGRYLYIVVSVETDGQTGTQPKVTRFLTREEALAINPELAKVQLREQQPLELQRTKPNSFNS
jgi:hypothetical protein